MRPLHVGLLVVGAALAGGLAVKMTQPPVFEASTAKPAAVTAKAAVPENPAPAVTAQATPQVAALPQAATAPPPVYTPDSKAKPSPSPNSTGAPPIRKWQPVVKKVAPTVMAKAGPATAPPATPTPAGPPAYQPLPAAPPQVESPSQAETPVPEKEVARIPDEPPAPMPLNPAPLQVTLRQGTQIAVRMDQAISSDHLAGGDTFQASLAEPLAADGYVIAEKGARVSGRVVESRNAGRMSGTSAIQLALVNVVTSDGQKIAISTEPWVKQADSGRNQEIAKIGGGAALGAIIGAIAGGGKGAAIGAGVGGAAGTGAAAATGGKAVTIPSETVIRFRLANKVTVTERPL